MNRMFVILNPWAGRGTAGQNRPALERALQQAGIEYTLVPTTLRVDATERAMQGVAQGYSHVVAVGGDGTINEVVNGIKRAERTTRRTAMLGIVPLGTGSDFARTAFGTAQHDLSTAVQRLTSARTVAVDLGYVQVAGGGRFFINGLGMGFDAQAAVEALKIKRLKGFAVYLAAIVQAQRRYQAPPMRVRYGRDRAERRLLFATVANGRFQGGGFMLTPSAKLNDGWLDVCMVDHMGPVAMLRHLPKVIRGTHTMLAEVTLARVQHVHVAAAAPIPVATDGEVLATGARTVAVTVVPGALEVCI